MSTIRIHGKDLPYDATDIIMFDEGLIGLPRLRSMVLVSQSDIFPFLWLASLDDPETAFLVVDIRTLFPDYAPSVAEEIRARLNLEAGQSPLMFGIVAIAYDWTRSTVNLRAPLFIHPAAMHGVQAVLVSSDYRIDQALPVLLDPSGTEDTITPDLSENQRVLAS